MITIRKGFIRAKEGTWYNLKYINFLEVTVFEDKYAVIANFDGKRELCYNLIGEFDTEIEAQKFLDDLMELQKMDEIDEKMNYYASHVVLNERHVPLWIEGDQVVQVGNEQYCEICEKTYADCNCPCECDACKKSKYAFDLASKGGVR